MQALAEKLGKKHRVYVLSPDLSPKPTRRVLVGKFPFPKKVAPGQTLSPLWFNNPVFWLYAAFYLARAVRKHQIDLIHVHGKYILPAGVLAGKLTRTPVAATVRDFKFLCPLAVCFTQGKPSCHFSTYLTQEIPEYLVRYQPNRLTWPFLAPWLVVAKLQQLVLKQFLLAADQVIAVSPELQKIYRLSGVKKVTTIYNVPPEALAKGGKQGKLARGKKTILSVGKLSYGKGSDTLIQAAGRLPEYRFILAGAKNISLKSKFPPNVTYLGQLPHAKVVKLYSKASLFIILSRWPEPLSRAGLEALSAGLPIIASNRGANPRLVKDNGLVVNPDDPYQVAAAIKKVVSRQNLKLLGQNSLKLLKRRFNRQKIVAAHLKLYNQLSR